MTACWGEHPALYGPELAKPSKCAEHTERRHALPCRGTLRASFPAPMWPTLARQPSSVYREDMTRHVTRGLAAQKYRRTRDVVRFSPPPGRYALEDLTT